MTTEAQRTYKRRWQKRRRLLEARGAWGAPYVDPARALAHIAHLRAFGLSHRTIDKLGGFSDKYSEQIASRTMIHRDTEAAILAIRFDLDAIPAHRLVSATGARRRLQALNRIGYPTRDLAARLGGSSRTFGEYINAERINARNARKVRDLYDELSMTTGPSTRASASAERKGWPAPLAWDDDSIDDPNATPADARNDPTHRFAGRPNADVAEDVAWLIEHDAALTTQQAADRLGMRVDSLQQALRRAGEHDRAQRLALNAELTSTANGRRVSA